MNTYHTRPSKHDVKRIAAIVARNARIPADNLFVKLYERRIVKARERAFLRILKETGCSMNGLADVWGCDASAVRRAVARQQERIARRPTMASAEAIAQHARTVAFLYPERARAILAGRDPATLADLARWNALGRKSAA